jgi:hypothetical protein
VPVIHTAADVRRAQADGHGLGDLIKMAAGPHPTGLLYGYIAESMVAEIVTALRDWHAVDLSSADD